MMVLLSKICVWINSSSAVFLWTLIISDESVLHLFDTCSFMDNIWRKVYGWIGSLGELNLEEFKSLFFKCEKVKNNLKRSIMLVIWLVSVWSLWLLRNNIIFNDVSPSFDKCMPAIV